MPTWAPGWNVVPRWRTRIEPAFTSSPPYALRPRRFDSESRPLREDPPAFLCAIAVSLTQSGDRVHTDFRVVLAMALRLLIVLAAAHLEDLQLHAAPVGDDGGGDCRSGHQGIADLHGVAVRDHQDLIEDNLSANVCRYLFYFDFFAGGNAVLLAAGFYDRVHCGLHCVETYSPAVKRPMAERTRYNTRNLP